MSGAVHNIGANVSIPICSAASGLLAPDDIAESYWALHRQPRSAWTHELDLRPWVEPW